LECELKAKAPRSLSITTLSTGALLGKLKEHKLEMNKLKEQENKDRKARGLALKTVTLR